MDQHLLTRSQAAEYLAVSTSTLAKWAAEQQGPRFCRIGGSVRYLRYHLDEFLEAAISDRVPS